MIRRVWAVAARAARHAAYGAAGACTACVIFAIATRREFADDRHDVFPED